MDAPVVAPATGGPKGWGLRRSLLGDERLARLIADGDEAAFTELYRRYHQLLYRYCRSLVGADADAQDALQSALTAALVALRQQRRDAPLRPWLFRIAHNESISLLRRRRPLQELDIEHESAEGPPEEMVEQRARLALLVADLRELPERQRGALVMRELSGLPHEEIALALGVSVGAAKQMVFEARRSLQEFAEGRAMSCEAIQRTVSDGDRRALRGRRVRAHLRECSGCRAFADAIPARRAELRALVPAMPAATAMTILARLTGAAPGHGAGAGLSAGVGGKGLGTIISTKLFAAGTAVVATVAVGAGVVHHFTNTVPAAAPAPTAHRSAPRPDAGPRAGASHAAGARAPTSAGGRHPLLAGLRSHRTSQRHYQHHQASALRSRGSSAGAATAGGRSPAASHSANASARSHGTGGAAHGHRGATHARNPAAIAHSHGGAPLHPVAGAGSRGLHRHPATAPARVPPARHHPTATPPRRTATTSTTDTTGRPGSSRAPSLTPVGARYPA